MVVSYLLISDYSIIHIGTQSYLDQGCTAVLEEPNLILKIFNIYIIDYRGT